MTLPIFTTKKVAKKIKTLKNPTSTGHKDGGAILIIQTVPVKRKCKNIT